MIKLKEVGMLLIRFGISSREDSDWFGSSLCGVFRYQTNRMEVLVLEIVNMDVELGLRFDILLLRRRVRIEFQDNDIVLRVFLGF